MISFKTILGFLFISLGAIIAILGIVSYQNNEQSVAASLRLAHSHQVIGKSGELLAAYQSARLAVNSMIIRKDTLRKLDYVAAMDRVSSTIKELRDLEANEAGRGLTLDSLEQELKHFKSVSDGLIKMVESKGADDSIRSVFLVTFNLRAGLTSRIERIKDAEVSLLASRQQTTEESVNAFKRTFTFLLVAILILLVATFFSIRYNFNKRQKAQEALARANVLFEKVFYESPISIVISELETGKILNCNKVFANLVNYEINEVLGKSPVELGIFESQEKRRELIDGATSKGMAKHAEVYIKPRDREPLFISLDAHIVMLYDRKCLLTAILDMSTHKKAEDEIKKALETEVELSKMKSDFVTLASHEFRTPLTTILSSVFLLENYLSGDHQKSLKHLARIKASVNNLTSILDEFLSVSKIEEGHVHPNVEKTDLPEYMEALCRDLQAFTKPGQVIHYSHTGEREVNTDPVLLGNIVSNLISNSIKYSPENSPIYVASMVNSRVHLTVEDKGIGIPEADQTKLFQRFFRASNAGNIQGTGLGLHIMKHYVEMLKGSVKLKSRVGEGTRVDLAFDHDE